jgi:cytochrome P450
MVTAINDDLFASDVIADPYTYFGRLREEDPVHWNEKYELWVITRYDDLVWLTRHHELFSSEVFKRDPRGPYPAIDESDLDLYNTFVRPYQSARFIQHDRPEHLEERMVVHGYFTPKSAEQWRPLIQSAIKELLDEAEEKGRMDVMADFATPLPVLVIAQIMGIPFQDRLFIRELAKKSLFLNRGERDRVQTFAEGVKEMMGYVSPLLDERVASPKDDLLSVLAEAEKRGVYNRGETLSNALLLLVAGHETTINLICNGILSFIRHPEQWELLKEDPAGRTVRATEECLRYDSPVKSIQRIATQDVELRGKVIHQDDRVRWFITSANRDPEVFPEPERFDIERYPNPHVAFGSGIHHCLGAYLARMEGQEALKALGERFPSLRVEVAEPELEYVPSMNFRSLKSLPVSWN